MEDASNDVFKRTLGENFDNLNKLCLVEWGMFPMVMKTSKHL